MPSSNPSLPCQTTATVVGNQTAQRSMAAPITTSRPPTGASCCYCGAPDVVLEWHERFKVLVCTSCFRKHVKLISKSNAKSAYLLSDSDLHPLGFVEKENPRNQKFNNMKQYLVRQVEDVAVAKHGSLEALEQEKQRRMQGKLEQRIQKRQAAEQQEERQREHEARLQATLDKYTATGADTQHGQGEHTFDDPVTGKRKKRFGSGLADVEVEEF